MSKTTKLPQNLNSWMIFAITLDLVNIFLLREEGISK